MKKLRRKQIVAAAIMIFCAACAGVGTVYADETTGKINPTDGLIAAIAQKFNLNESDVQAVFNERRTQMQARREQNREQMEVECQTEFADRIAKAVAGGKLTQSQADLITAKRVELKAAKTNLEGKTAGERRAAMETQSASLKQWAADNNIPEEYISMCGRGFGRGGHGFGGSMPE